MFNNFSKKEVITIFFTFCFSLLSSQYDTLWLLLPIVLYVVLFLLNNFHILFHYIQLQKRLRMFSQAPTFEQDRDIQDFVKEAKKAYFNSVSKHQAWNVIHLMTLAWLNWRQNNMSTVFCYKYLLKNIYADSDLSKESAFAISEILYKKFSSSSTNNRAGALIHYLRSSGYQTKKPDWNEDSAIKFVNF